MFISLLDRQQGATASYIFKRLGVSPAARIADLEREVETLRRYIAFNIRVPLGLELGDARHQVDFDRFGRMQLYSSDDSVVIQRNPNAKTNVVDLRAASSGCANAYNMVEANEGDTVDASSCDDFAILGESDATLVRVVTKGIEGSPDKIGARIEGTVTAGDPGAVNCHVIMRGRGGQVVHLHGTSTLTPNPSDSYSVGST